MVLAMDQSIWIMLHVMDLRTSLLTVLHCTLENLALTADLTSKMLQFSVHHVCNTDNNFYSEHLHTFCYLLLVCPDAMFECHDGRINGQQSPCIASEQRCNGVTDCIGGEDELEYNCPCGPEGAVRLVDGIVPYRGRVEFCKNGRWSSICKTSFYTWDNSEAAVVCRQLGYQSEGILLQVYLNA